MAVVSRSTALSGWPVLQYRSMSRGLTTAGLTLLRSASASSEMARPAAPLDSGEIRLLDRPGLSFGLQLDQRIFHELDVLVELIELFLELGSHFGRKIFGLAGVEHELKAVAGEVQRIGAHVEPEQLEVETEQLAARLSVESGGGVVWIAKFKAVTRCWNRLIRFSSLGMMDRIRLAFSGVMGIPASMAASCIMRLR